MPNVVYSCGALLHQQTLLLPYGCSDSAIRFTYVNMPELVANSAAGEASLHWRVNPPAGAARA